MSDELIEKYRTVLASDVWRQNPLLKVLATRLSVMLKSLERSPKPIQDPFKGLVPVYVVLYHQQGTKLSIWESLIKRIHSAIKGRPVFLSELEAKTCISDRLLEGYVELMLPKSSIMLHEGSYYIRPSQVRLDAVRRFFWYGHAYQFKLGVLEPCHNSD